MKKEFKTRTIALGVSGGIAAYKALEIVRLLKRKGHSVFPLMTENAKRFITPLSLQALSENKVYDNLFSLENPDLMEHIRQAREADIFLVAPATANSIAKMAQGLADDPLSTLYLAFNKKVLLAPAMNDEMWAHQAVQDNLNILKKRGVLIIEPDSGPLACGAIGLGRLAEPLEIVKEIEKQFALNEDLKGRRILITAGPTREAIDPVRFISNPSSGKMGYALAKQAQSRGAQVTLVSGPTALDVPAGVTRIMCMSAFEMRDRVMESLGQADALIMSAAVGDFAPKVIEKEKVKKQGQEPLQVTLYPTPDILKEVAIHKTNQVVIGFAAESENLIENASSKLVAKKLDLILANDISAPGIGFDSDYNQIALLAKNMEPEYWPKETKIEIADRLLDRLAKLFEEGE